MPNCNMQMSDWNFKQPIKITIEAMNEWMNEMGKKITDQKTTTTNIDPNLGVNSKR